MKNGHKIMIIGLALLLFPVLGYGQSGVANEIGKLQGVLDQLYDEMIPLCSKLTGVGRGIAGFAALWYIASRVWRHLANAEPIDFYPLFRPFVLGFCILMFPAVIAMINGIMKPTVSGTNSMVENSNKAVADLLKQKEEAVKKSDTWKMYIGDDDKGDKDRWYRYTHEGADPSEQGMFESVGNDFRFSMEKFSYKFRNSVKQWMSEILQVLFQAAALCINTLRTFQLIVLAIIGPIVFGLAVFDGLQFTLTSWLARYINIYLWLPVANIFGAIISKIQEQMLHYDIGQISETGDTFFSATDTGYLIFMIIGIIGYFTVPSVANSIVNAGGAGAMAQRVTNMAGSTADRTVSAGAKTGAQAGGSLIQSVKKIGGNFFKVPGSGFTNDDPGNPGNHDRYMSDKLSGRS